MTGVSLPFGDANCPTGGVALTLSGSTSYICNANSADQIDMGWATLHFSGPLAMNQDKKPFFENARAFTPSVRGAACVYNLTGTMFHPVRGVTFQPELETHNGTDKVYGLDYAMVAFPLPTEQDSELSSASCDEEPRACS